MSLWGEPLVAAPKKGKKSKKGQKEPESSSPFSSDMVKISVESTTLHVHQAIVEPIPELWDQFKSALPFDSFMHADMKHLSLDVAHVLVQWLYSGTYQPLMAQGTEVPLCPSRALKTAFGAYSLARQYKLLGLETLAREEISRLAADTSISSFFDVIQQTYPKTFGKDDWLKECVTSVMKAAMKKNEQPSLEMPEETNDDMGGAPVVGIIVKGLLDAYREMVAEVEAANARVQVVGAAPKISPPTPTPTPITTPSNEPTTAVDPVVSQEPLTLPTSQASDGSQHEAIIDLAEAAYEELTPRTEEPAPEPAVPEPEPQPDHTPEDQAEAVIDEWATPIKGKKDKKKKKSKTKAVVEEEPAPLAEPEAAPEPEPEPEPEPAVPEAPAEVDVDEWAAPAAKKKKKKKSVSIGSWADLVDEPEALMMEKEEAAAVTVVPVTEVEAENDPWVYWGARKSPRQSLS